MKKILLILLTVMMTLSLAGCGSKNEGNITNNEVQITDNNKKEEETKEDFSAALSEYAGNYRLTSVINNGEELLTEEMKAQGEEVGLYLKMTVIEDGRAYLDFINQILRFRLDPEAMTMKRFGETNTFPFTYDGDTFKILIDDNNSYTYVKDDSVGQVIMWYEAEGLTVEDPYLMNWGPLSVGGDNVLLLYSEVLWLDVRCFDKDSDDKELLAAIERFSPQYGDPSVWDTYTYEYLTEEEDESFFMNYFCVGADHYYTVRSWCYQTDRSIYEPIIQDLFDNHLYFNDWAE